MGAQAMGGDKSWGRGGCQPPNSGEGEAGGKGCVGHPEVHPPGLKTAHVGS